MGRVAVPVEAMSCPERFRRALIVVPMAEDLQGASLLGAFVRATKGWDGMSELAIDNHDVEGKGGLTGIYEGRNDHDTCYCTQIHDPVQREWHHRERYCSVR